MGARLRGLEVLTGVGDDDCGHWEETGAMAYHIRRRLAASEEALVGPACDLRGTREASKRLTAAWRWLPTTFRMTARQECAVLTPAFGRALRLK